MSDATSGPLRDAYEAIQANQLPKARGILSTYVSEKPNDPDAWWLYSYAAENPTEARKALENVLRLDPMYPGARDLLNEVNQSIPATPSSPAPLPSRNVEDSSQKPPVKPASSVDDDFDDLDDLDDDEDDSSGGSSRRTLLAIAGFLLVILVVVVIFVVLPRANSPATPTAVALSTTTPQGAKPVTQEAGTETPTVDVTTDAGANITITQTVESDPTDEPIATPDEAQPTETVTVSTLEATATPDEAAVIDTDLSVFYTALGGLTVAPDSVMMEQTSVGQTLNATVCLQNQAELRTAIPAAIPAIASASNQAPADTEFIGVKFVDCANNNLLRYVVVPIAQARAYAEGTLSATDLRSAQRNITR